MKVRVYFFETQTGKSPIKKFIDGLPLQDQSRFFEVIEEIELNGIDANTVTLKPIEGKLWEVKFRSIHSYYRVFYTLLDKELMVWIHAFSKKTQKTPIHELNVARKRLKEIKS